MKINKKSLLGAAVTGVLLAAAYGPVAHAQNAGGEMGECHGVNECKGQGDCGGVRKDGTKYGCSGNNECKGQGYITMRQSDCNAKGGIFKANT